MIYVLSPDMQSTNVAFVIIEIESKLYSVECQWGLYIVVPGLNVMY